MNDFRFETLDIWKEGIVISDTLFKVADIAEKNKNYRFAEQLRAAAMSITNNIAEGSGSFSNKEFSTFINYSRRSVFECANILHIFERRELITGEQRGDMNAKLVLLSKKLTNFRKSLR